LPNKPKKSNSGRAVSGDAPSAVSLTAGGADVAGCAGMAGCTAIAGRAAGTDGAAGGGVLTERYPA
jgi:hypothetical protein